MNKPVKSQVTLCFEGISTLQTKVLYPFCAHSSSDENVQKVVQVKVVSCQSDGEVDWFHVSETPGRCSTLTVI